MSKFAGLCYLIKTKTQTFAFGRATLCSKFLLSVQIIDVFLNAELVKEILYQDITVVV